MQLSSETRKRAVEAFKEEFESAIANLRSGLASPATEWKGKEHKMTLHRLKGGAGFLGYAHLSIGMAEFECNVLQYPADPQKWLELLGIWESELAKLS